MRLLRIILVLGAFVHLSGGHYGVLQGIAWATMLVQYSAADGLVEGARKTFDGDHPCEMCRSIASAKQQESQREPSLPATGIEKLSLKDLRPPEPIALRHPRARDHGNASFISPDPIGGLAGARPPLPPPRGV